MKHRNPSARRRRDGEKRAERCLYRGKDLGRAQKVRPGCPPPAYAPADCTRPADCKRPSSCTWDTACTRLRSESRPSPHGPRTERKGSALGPGQFPEACPPALCRALGREGPGAEGATQFPLRGYSIPCLSCVPTWMKAGCGDPAYRKIKLEVGPGYKKTVLAQT